MLTAKPVIAIAMMTAELAKAAGSVAELALSSTLTSASARAIDDALLNPANSGTDNRPASLVNGVPPIVCAAVTPAAIDAALQAAIAALVAAASDLSSAVWACSPQTATRLAGVRGTGGAPSYPQITARGGELMGLPVLTSRTMVSGQMQLIDGAAVALGDEGESSMVMSKQTSLKILDDDFVTEILVSMFQTETEAVKAVRYLAWKLTVPGRAQRIVGIGGA